MSSNLHRNFPASKAIDGIYIPSDSGLSRLASLAHSKQHLSPWIQVDLTTNHYVEGVKIWDRFEEGNPSKQTINFF